MQMTNGGKKVSRKKRSKQTYKWLKVVFSEIDKIKERLNSIEERVKEIEDRIFGTS